MRLRIVFSKTGALRYIGHLDLQTVWERTVRRAGLPLAYTHGFHPGPKIQIASALPLGFLGRREIVDIWLQESSAPGGVREASPERSVWDPAAESTPSAPGSPPAAESTPSAPGGVPAAESTPSVPGGVREASPERSVGDPAADLPVGPTPAPGGVREASPERSVGDPAVGLPAPAFWGLQPAAPPGLTILSVEQVVEGAPALQTQVVSAEYEITLLEPVSIPDLDKRLQELLAAGSLPRQRRGRDYDLRPLVEELSLTQTPPLQGQGPGVRVHMLLSARQGATGRPEEVLDLLGIPFETTRIERTRLILKSGIE